MNGISQIETRLKLTSHGDGAGSNFQFEIDWWRNFYGAKLASTEPLVPPPPNALKGQIQQIWMLLQNWLWSKFSRKLHQTQRYTASLSGIDCGYTSESTLRRVNSGVLSVLVPFWQHFRSKWKSHLKSNLFFSITQSSNLPRLLIVMILHWHF